MSKKKILIVEDESVLRDVYKLILSKDDAYDVIEAKNGLEGLEKLKKHLPDLVLLDLFMPVMDGISFLQNFDRDDHADIKIIVYSNMSDDATVKEAKFLGADDFVLKSSFNPTQLLELVENTLK